MSVEEHWSPKHVVCSIFLVYVFSDHSVIYRKCTPGWRGCKIAWKGYFYFYPPKRVTSPTSDHPHPCKEALKVPNCDILTSHFDTINGFFSGSGRGGGLIEVFEKTLAGSPLFSPRLSFFVCFSTARPPFSLLCTYREPGTSYVTFFSHCWLRFSRIRVVRVFIEQFSYDLEKWFRQMFVICFISQWMKRSKPGLSVFPSKKALIWRRHC